MASSVQACSVTPTGTGTKKRSARPMATEVASGTSFAPGHGAAAGWPLCSPAAADTVALTGAACIGSIPLRLSLCGCCDRAQC